MAVSFYFNTVEQGRAYDILPFSTVFKKNILDKYYYTTVNQCPYCTIIVLLYVSVCFYSNAVEQDINILYLYLHHVRLYSRRSKQWRL
jgi:hypothetical protein